MSFTVRPLAWLRGAATTAALSAFLLSPGQLSQASSDVSARVPTQRELARGHAVQAVDSAIARRSRMDGGSRAALAGAIVDHAVANRIDPLFVVAIIQNESGFDARSRSIRCRAPGIESTCYLNAQGLMQVIPSTAGAEARRRKLGKLDMLDPIDNVNVGVGYLGHLGTGFRRIQSVLWAYNQGPAVAMAHIRGSPPAGWSDERWEKSSREGQAFEHRVLSTYRKLLAEQGIRADVRRMGTLYREPTMTVYNAPVISSPAETALAQR